MFYMNFGLNESSGSNGLMGRIAQAKYEAEKKKNDEYDATIEKKREQYKRAGYEDKAPARANRDEEKAYKDLADNEKYNDDFKRNTGSSFANKVQSYSDDSYHDDRCRNMADAAYKIKKEYDHREDKNRMTERQLALHNRINNRAKHECGIFAEAVFIDE